MASPRDSSPVLRRPILFNHPTKKVAEGSEPEVRTLRCIRSMLASLGMLDKDVRKVAPDTRRERLQKRIMDLMKSMQLARAALQGIHCTTAAELTVPVEAPGCIHCGCTCRTRTFPTSQIRAIDLRPSFRISRCALCSQALLGDSDICEQCRLAPRESGDPGTSLYLQATVTTEIDTSFHLSRPSLSPLSSRRLLKLRRGEARSISPDPRYLLPVTTRPAGRKAESTQTDLLSTIVTLAVGRLQVQLAGAGPHMCRLVLPDFAESTTNEATHRRATTDALPPLADIKSLEDVIAECAAGLNESETLVQDIVNTLEQTKQRYLSPGVADRAVERLVKVFGRLHTAVRAVLPSCAVALELVVQGLVLVCEAVTTSHADMLQSLDAQKTAEKEAHMKALSDQVTRLQNELVATRYSAAAEVAALKHTVHTYEQRLHTLFAALKSSNAL